MTMPSLPKVPSAERIDFDENGVISGHLWAASIYKEIIYEVY